MFGPNLGRRGRGNAGRNGQGLALMLMLVRQIQQLERKPPVTLALMALMYGLHFQKCHTPELFAPYSLCPDRVLHNWDLTRIVASGLIHVDDWHLYHNMASFLWKGYNLEYKLGSMRFLLTVGYLLVLCHVLVVAIALALAMGFQMPEPLHQCSVGFSGVLFALKVLLNHNSPAFSSVYGFQVPTKYAAWLELVVIHFLVPRSSFMGHMCGIVAGYIFVYSPSMQSAMTTAARRISQFVKLAAGPFSDRQDTSAHPSPPHPPRQSPRPPASSSETDEQLARRLQEEEYRSQQAPRQQPDEPVPDRISPTELRRRRLARFSNRQSAVIFFFSVMNRGVRRRLLSLGLWPSLLDAVDHVAWKLQLFSVALLHLLFSSDKQWIGVSPSSQDTAADPASVLLAPSPSAVTKRKRILFVRHAESEWNVVFNRGLNVRLLVSLLRAVVREWLLLPTGDSVLLDSPLSGRGRFQAQSLQELVSEATLRCGQEIQSPPIAGYTHSHSLNLTEEHALLKFLCCPMPGSVVVASNLRRSIDTARIASASRLEAPGQRIHVLSCLQEIGRNVDTLAISGPHAVQPQEVLVQAPCGEKRHDELFNVAESYGNKAVLGSGRDRLRSFAHWVFKQQTDVVVVYGHSLWFRAFCREFFPSNVHHEAKSVKMNNCGVVTFVLEEQSRGGGEVTQYTIQPESFQHLV